MYCSLVDEFELKAWLDHSTRKIVDVGCIKMAWQSHIQSNGAFVAYFKKKFN